MHYVLHDLHYVAIMFELCKLKTNNVYYADYVDYVWAYFQKILCFVRILRGVRDLKCGLQSILELPSWVSMPTV